MWRRGNSYFGIRVIFAIILLGISLKSLEGTAGNVQISGTEFLFSPLFTEERTQNHEEQLILENNEFKFDEEMEDNENDGEYEVDEEDELDSKSLIEMVKSMEKEANDEAWEKQGRKYEYLDYFSFGRNDVNVTTPDSHKNQRSALIFNEGNVPGNISSYFKEDIVDDIMDRIKDSLVLSGSLNNITKKHVAENRADALYLFLGQYMAEPRLNRFIDGAIRNMVNEIKVGVMDPLYFRVLPRGQVISRVKPRQVVKQTQVKLVPGRKRRRRRKPGVQIRRPKNRRRIPKKLVVRNRGVRRKAFDHPKNRRKVANGGIRRKTLNQGKRPQVQNRRRKQRTAGRGIGSGRVEGLSKIERDGDAEMQMYGNYTMIRSHMKIGPVVLNMQFRTRRGLRSTGASLPDLKLHTVTRVNLAGSEMVDFVLDRPHPETIQLRGKLFPLAERVAKNIFARLFVPGSFLVARIREKIGISMLSKPKLGNEGY